MKVRACGYGLPWVELEVYFQGLLTLLGQVVVPPTVPSGLLSFLFYKLAPLYHKRASSRSFGTVHDLDLEALYLVRALWKLQQYEGMVGAAIDFLLFCFDSLSTITVSCERIPGELELEIISASCLRAYD